MRLNYVTLGEGEPLLILHGLFGSLQNWHGIARALAGQHSPNAPFHSFRVLNIDLRNHGKSPHSSQMDHAAIAEDLMILTRENGIGRACVLGHSLGGKVAMHLALNHPQLVAKLVIVDIGPWAYPPGHRDILDALLALDLHRLTDRKQAEDALAPAIPDLAVRRFLLTNLVRGLDGAFRWRINLPAINDNYDSLNGPVSGSGPFNGPTLFLRGGNSDYLVENDIDRLRVSFPNAELQTIPGAGHWVHHDAPDAFLDAVRDFLDDPSH